MADTLHVLNGESPEKRKQLPPGSANSFFHPAQKRLKQEENASNGYSPSPDIYPQPSSKSPPHASTPRSIEGLFAEPVSPVEEDHPISVKIEEELEAISSDEDEKEKEVAVRKVVVPQTDPLQECLAALGLLGNTSSGPPPAWLIRQPVPQKPASLWTERDPDATNQTWSLKSTKSLSIPPKSGSAINIVAAGLSDELVGGSVKGEVVFFGEVRRTHTRYSPEIPWFT